QRLGAKVLGQPTAVALVGRALAAATLGIDFVADPRSLEARPKGVFFGGPTGEGKTELARALSDFVFYDETAMCRFDMSSFAEPHNAERFCGAPPRYVGHERGGELTNRLHERPFSVLLFDEVEKAHTSVFDKFLQIREDGRLTDGLGRTAYFSQSLIIFTSNLGAESIYQHSARGGGVVALVVAYRRQHVGEAAEAREHGRALTDRLGAAAEQLGSERPAVRIAGAYAMARLADDWPQARQTCINVLCGYLRLLHAAEAPR
ncbi:MAG TPA: AAA family ATPase, partial [Trebonia sp.]|nr:AAA family ATPase [Trebonia sp.]